MSFRELLSYDRFAVYHLGKELLRTPLTAANRWQLATRRIGAIGYIGWAGHSNLGDEAMFDEIVESFSDFKIVPLLPEPGERLISRLGVGPGVFDAVLLGGGTLINCDFIAVARLVQEQQVPLYSLGTGVGSCGFNRPENSCCLDLWEDIFRTSSLVSVRGPLSQGMLEHAGVRKIQVIGDPALKAAPDHPPVFRTRRRLVINLAQESGTPYGSGQFQVFRSIAEIAADFLNNGGEVVGVALGDRDRAVLENFRTENNLTMGIEDHRHSVQGFFDTVMGSLALIGVRLHSAVLASCVGVPSMLFVYRLKCRDFMSSMDLDDFALPLSADTSPQLLRSRFERILSEPDLGERIYRKAISWKHKQEAYYEEVRAEIETVSARTH